MSSAKRKWVRRVAIAIGCYLVIYVINSRSGGYWPELDYGRHAYEGSVGMPTLMRWQPYLGHSDSQQTTFAGLVYFPLIQADQRWWHRNLDLFDDEKKLWPSAGEMSSVKWHPRYREKPKSKSK